MRGCRHLGVAGSCVVSIRRFSFYRNGAMFICVLVIHTSKVYMFRGRAGNRAGRAGLGRANSGLGQNRAGPKLARFFRAKILTAQPALKTGLIGKNSLLKEKKILASRAEPYRAGPNLARFFLAKNLMAQPGPNSGQTWHSPLGRANFVTSIYRYFNYNSNIKCVDSTIKYIGFELFHYSIKI